MNRFALLAVLAFAASACSEEAPPPAAPAPAAPAAAPAAVEAAPQAAAAAPTAMAQIVDWDAAAVAKIESLGGKLRNAGVECPEIEWVNPGMYLQHLRETMHLTEEQLPLAEGYCTSDEQEDLTFSVFRSAEHAKHFVDAKQAFLCRRAAKLEIWDFPGVPYLLHEDWVLTPDERSTAVRLGDILGGTGELAACNLQAPTPTP